VKVYTINASRYFAKTRCNMLIIVQSRNRHASGGANRLSFVAVTVKINAERNLSSISWQ
jgi:hypothetical protein